MVRAIHRCNEIDNARTRYKAQSNSPYLTFQQHDALRRKFGRTLGLAACEIVRAQKCSFYQASISVRSEMVSLVMKYGQRNHRDIKRLLGT